MDAGSIDRAATDLDDDLTRFRRDIHRWPELAGAEKRTAARVAHRLRAEGLAVTAGVGGHGVVAVLDGADAGPTVAYRADMDAIDGDETFDGDFASRVPGAAHLCGHDLHTAIGVGIAQVLARLRHRLSGRVVFIFQPAEETLDGARAMIADGVLEWTAPQEIYALHCDSLPVGTFAVMPGYGLPGQDRYHVELSGPNAAADGKRLVAAIDALSTVGYPRTPEQFQRLLSDLRRRNGPLARFVLAESVLTVDEPRAQVRGSLRAWPHDRHPRIRDEVRRLVESIDGARLEFPGRPFPAMVCSAPLSEAAAAYLRDAIGTQAVISWHAAFPFHGEDFALFLQRVPGAMFLLGVANSDAGRDAPPHAPDFAADERAIGIGVRAMAGLLSGRLHALRQ